MMIAELALVFALQAGATPSSVVTELEQIEQKLGSTYQNADCDGWGALLAPEWSVIHVTGHILTRAQAIAVCKSPRPHSHSFTIDEVSVRAFGDAAVVTGRTRATAGGNSPQSITLRFTDVFIHRDGKWLVIASQATQVQQ